MSGIVKKSAATVRKAVARDKQATSITGDIDPGDPPARRATRLGYTLPDSPPTVYNDGVTVAVPLDSGKPRPADAE